MKSLYVMVLGCVVCVYVSLVQLGNTYFWDDEAHVGIIAKNYLATGGFTGWDGRNLLAFRNGSLLDNHLRIINPPLEYFLTAASFRAFGPSTWAGRFPFVIAGLLSVVVFLRLIQDTVGKDIRFWGYAVGGLAFSTVFLLNIRQSRYYALALLFSLLTYQSYRACVRTKRWGDFLTLACWATLLFYSNHLLGIAFLLALTSVHAVFSPTGFSRQAWKKLLLTLALFAVATVPYALHYQIWYRPDILSREIWYLRKARLLWWHLRELNGIGYFPWVAAVGLGAFLVRYRTQQTPILCAAREWLTLGLTYVIFLALLSPQPTVVPTLADVRYMIPVLPFFLGLVGLLLSSLHEKMPALALTLFIINVTTNVFTLAPFNRELRWLFPAYLKEIHQDYPTSYRAVSQFLQRHARPDELVLAYPPHTNYPLIFYTGDRFSFCCLLNNRTPLLRQEILELPAHLFMEQHLPDWFIAFGLNPTIMQILNFFSHHPHNTGEHGPLSYFQPVEFIDVYWGDTHRPELPLHSFGAKTDFDRDTEAVYIFKRVKNRHMTQDMGSSEKLSLP